MSEPLVCGMILTADRPQFVETAIRCFNLQTYANKRLFVYDTGEVAAIQKPGIQFEWVQNQGLTIGQLRNCAIRKAKAQGRIEADIIMHFDDDDWSSPHRMAEQVELLQSTEADVVGYRDLLFWREGCRMERNMINLQSLYQPESSGRVATVPMWTGEAWHYKGTLLGTSLCYWRKVWEQKPFPPTSQGEDTQWLMGLKQRFTSSIGEDGLPRMIARIHGGNTSNGYDPQNMAGAREWQRVPEWDDCCRNLFAREERHEAKV